MCSIYRYKLKIQSLSAVIKEVRTKTAIGLWVLLCHCGNFYEECTEDLDYLSQTSQASCSLVPRSQGSWESVPSAGSSIACQRNSQNWVMLQHSCSSKMPYSCVISLYWSCLFYFWCLSSLSFKSQLFSPWRLCWKGGNISVCTVSLATFGHLYVNLSLTVTLTASKRNDLQLLPAPQPRLCPSEQWYCILDCLWTPGSELFHGITCALTCVLWFQRPAGLAR